MLILAATFTSFHDASFPLIFIMVPLSVPLIIWHQYFIISHLKKKRVIIEIVKKRTKRGTKTPEQEHKYYYHVKCFASKWVLFFSLWMTTNKPVHLSLHMKVCVCLLQRGPAVADWCLPSSSNSTVNAVALAPQWVESPDNITGPCSPL